MLNCCNKNNHDVDEAKDSQDSKSEDITDREGFSIFLNPMHDKANNSINNNDDGTYSYKNKNNTNVGDVELVEKKDDNGDLAENEEESLKEQRHLFFAAIKNDNANLVQQFITENPNLIDTENTLQHAIKCYKHTLDIVKMLLEQMSIEDINHKNKRYGYYTPLDWAYESRKDNIVEVIKLIRQYGGKSNWHDKDGNWVGMGKGDLNLL